MRSLDLLVVAFLVAHSGRIAWQNAFGSIADGHRET